jgi:hypothetical protein
MVTAFDGLEMNGKETTVCFKAVFSNSSEENGESKEREKGKTKKEDRKRQTNSVPSREIMIRPPEAENSTSAGGAEGPPHSPPGAQV